MALPDIEIDLLRAFLAVAEAGSMTGGAEIVGRTQSAVSQKILRLEDLIGKRVFERSSRSLALTSNCRACSRASPAPIPMSRWN